VRRVGVRTIALPASSGTRALTEQGDTLPDETYPPPLDIIARWPYYASKAYQEMAALERFNGKGLRLVIMNPSLLLGPGDDRLSSTDRKSTRLNSSHQIISYAVFCLKKKK